MPARGVGFSADAALAGLAFALAAFALALRLAALWAPSAACAGSVGACGSWPAASPSCAVRGALWRVRGRDRRAALVVQLDPEVGRAHAAVEQAGRGGEDVVGGEAEPLGAAADRAQGLAPVGRAARRVVERRQDGRELLLAEVGGVVMG